ncbi:transporter substrate-binding domain-containing protein [Aquipseudomonas campi]|uniref:Transporter substrate-binding domain-containing protein n=1 Tax=Aquipseudomonas campi TaxID=2731681 RepID=A0A6M8FGT7_9GAMM|nr:transporter substrate-binding domain-containing protein [Pseudomonas campi]QKE63977.1 transporter substrate-binding domain-containing protein [Pseudomonas campi]
MQLRRKLLVRGASFLLAFLAGSAHGETLTIAGDIWCPINCEPGSAKPGIFVELARDIFAESGIQVHYQARNWARVLQEVRRGEINAAVGAGHDDAPDFLFTREPVALSRNCFYTSQDSAWRYAGVESLPAVRLGVINDYSYGPQINAYIDARHGHGDRVQKAAGDQALNLNLSKLMHGRLDALIENSWVIQARLAALGHNRNELREAGCRETDAPIYLAFSPALPSSARYVELFEQGLQRYRADGRMQVLLESYGVGQP